MNDRSVENGRLVSAVVWVFLLAVWSVLGAVGCGTVPAASGGAGADSAKEDGREHIVRAMFIGVDDDFVVWYDAVSGTAIVHDCNYTYSVEIGQFKNCRSPLSMSKGWWKRITLSAGDIQGMDELFNSDIGGSWERTEQASTKTTDGETGIALAVWFQTGSGRIVRTGHMRSDMEEAIKKKVMDLLSDLQGAAKPLARRKVPLVATVAADGSRDFRIPGFPTASELLHAVLLEQRESLEAIGRTVGQLPLRIQTISGTDFRCNGVHVRLLGVKPVDSGLAEDEADEATQRELVRSAFLDNLAGCDLGKIRIVNRERLIRDADGVPLVWLGVADFPSFSINEAMVALCGTCHENVPHGYSFTREDAKGRRYYVRWREELWDGAWRSCIGSVSLGEHGEVPPKPLPDVPRIDRIGPCAMTAALRGRWSAERAAAFYKAHAGEATPDAAADPGFEGYSEGNVHDPTETGCCWIRWRAGGVAGDKERTVVVYAETDDDARNQVVLEEIKEGVLP